MPSVVNQIKHLKLSLKKPSFCYIAGKTKNRSSNLEIGVKTIKDQEIFVLDQLW